MTLRRQIILDFSECHARCYKSQFYRFEQLQSMKMANIEN